MRIKLCFIGFFLIINNSKFFGYTPYNKGFAVSRETLINYLNADGKRSTLSLSFDFQPHIYKNNSPFYILPTKGWNIHLIKPIYQNKHNYQFGLNFNLNRRIEECRIQNISNPILAESRLQFQLKSIVSHLGVFSEKKCKYITYFFSINYGYFFDGEYAWKHHLKFTNIPDTVDFKYGQYYSFTRRKFPVMIQIGFIKFLTKKICIQGLIYNNEFKTIFTQNYSISHNNTNTSNLSKNQTNIFGINVGIGYKF